MQQREQARIDGMKTERVCPVCHQPFIPKSREARVCSSGCYNQLRRDTLAKQRSRPFTDTTVYLVHKYILEGSSIREVMNLLGRSEESIRMALETELTPAQRARIDKHLIPNVRKRRNIA